MNDTTQSRLPLDLAVDPPEPFKLTPLPADDAAKAALRADILAAYASAPLPAAPVRRRTAPQPLHLRYTCVGSPVGLTYAACTEQGIAFLTWTSSSFDAFALLVRSRYPGAELTPDDSISPQVEQALAAYANSDPRPFVDLSRLTPFERQVLGQCAAIPRGTVRPYGWIAREIGNPGAVRAVGTALARNPVPLLIPCHRVVAGTGRLGNYSGGGPDMKAELLRREGVDLEHLPQALQM